MENAYIALDWQITALVTEKRFNNRGWCYSLCAADWAIDISEPSFVLDETKAITIEVSSRELTTTAADEHHLDEEIETKRTVSGKPIVDPATGIAWVSWHEGEMRVYFFLGSNNDEPVRGILNDALLNPHTRVSISLRIDLDPEKPEGEFPCPWCEDFMFGVNAHLSFPAEFALVGPK